MRDQTVVGVGVSREGFFLAWLQLTNPRNKLREGEMTVLAALLATRHELSRDITSDMMVDRYLFSSEGRRMVLDRLPGFKPQQLYTALTCLRQKGCILDENRLNKAMVPDYTGTSSSFKLTFMFDIKQEDAVVADGGQGCDKNIQDEKDTDRVAGSLQGGGEADGCAGVDGEAGVADVLEHAVRGAGQL
jgi:hypothetical protein